MGLPRREKSVFLNNTIMFRITKAVIKRTDSNTKGVVKLSADFENKKLKPKMLYPSRAHTEPITDLFIKSPEFT